jgi:sialate O-acetylesterase
VIWYQGENNGGAGLEYRTLFPRLIEDWRTQWKEAGTRTNGDFPFIFVQLPCNGPDLKPVADGGWPYLREAQFMTLREPNTAMAITIDIGDPKNVHPADKIDVGIRLSLAAKKLVYGENVVASGPLFKSSTVEPGGYVRIQFSETGSGLTIGQSPWYAPGVKPFPKDKLTGFFIAGKDKKWVEADARIDGTSVIVSSRSVPSPEAVRYGWANSPCCNLYNKEGLPASPFRTDDWLN